MNYLNVPKQVSAVHCTLPLSLAYFLRKEYILATASVDVDVHGKCEKAKCGCMKGAFMCGKEVGKYRQH